MDPKPAGNVPNRQALVLGFTISMTVLATVAVALRILARKISDAKFWYDDYMCLFALVRTNDWKHTFSQINECRRQRLI